jgi:hypothetical protein
MLGSGGGDLYRFGGREGKGNDLTSEHVLMLYKFNEMQRKIIYDSAV